LVEFGANQVAQKKSHLNHLANFFASNPQCSEHERKLAEVYPEVIGQLDEMFDAFAAEREFNGSHRTLRMGVYNSYWSTAGGGELHALNVANYLARFGVVDLISETDFDLDMLLHRFQFPRERFRKILLRPLAPEDTAAYDVFVNSTVASNLVSKAAHSFFIVSFPHQAAPAAMLDSYTFLPNSFYTSHWCRAFWGTRRTEMLYPLVRRVVEEPDLECKEKIILNVGRFFPDGHCKMQHEIVKTFKELVARYPEYADWKLVCAGGVDQEREDCLAYFDQVSELAAGANVELMPDVSFEKLNTLYARSAIYWHATGFGKDVELSPYEFEHFGISTVEAMSAGCIPVVIDAGGQSEIVNDEAFGSRFITREQWIEGTVQWMARFERDRAGYEAASLAAAARAECYQSAAFEERMNAIFAEVRDADGAIERKRPKEEFCSNRYWRLDQKV